MMKTNSKTLIWIIVILVATNLSTIGSFYYHRANEEQQIPESKPGGQTTVPGEQRTRFFRDQLNLDNSQIERFREINRSFNRTARDIEMSLSELRKEIVDELGKASPDSAKLDQLAMEIGSNHRELKQVTTRFYLNMKEICTTEQQEKLYTIFQSMLTKENQINLPQPGYMRGRGPNR